MKISVLGLGYVGLPLALLAKSRGLDVRGVDKDPAVVRAIKRRHPHITDNLVSALLKENDLPVSVKLESSDIYIICVPTPVNKYHDPDLSCLIQAVREVGDVLADNQLVIIESTINPGVSEDILKPILDSSSKKYYLAHCPERINPGDKNWNIMNIPRVLGGICTESVKRAERVYRHIIDGDIYILSDIKEAEATKILENTFRDVNIAFINEMAMSFHKLNINIIEVIKAASTKPFGFLPHYPGIGVGGHCIAVDTYYMIEKGRQIGFLYNFLTAARKINSNMPMFAVSLLTDLLNEFNKSVKGSVIALLGISYKANVEDCRESPFYRVVDILKEKGAGLRIYDPFFKSLSTAGSMQEALAGADVALIITDHDQFLDVDAYKGILGIVDGRNCLPSEKVEKMGMKYVGIGIPLNRKKQIDDL